MLWRSSCHNTCLSVCVIDRFPFRRPQLHWFCFLRFYFINVDTSLFSWCASIVVSVFRLDTLNVQVIINVNCKATVSCLTVVLTVFGDATEVVLMLVVCGSRILSTPVGRLHTPTPFVGWDVIYQHRNCLCGWLQGTDRSLRSPWKQMGKP